MQPVESGLKNVNGLALYYEIYGSGRPLVLVHGGGGSIRFDYAEIIAGLSSEYKLIGVDLQNHGRSGHRDIPETFEQDARDLAGLIEALGIKKASFMGFSNGGNTVMQVAHLFPEKVDRLIVASAFYKRNGMTEGFFEGMAQATIDFMPQPLKDNFMKLNPDEALLMNMFEKDSQRMIHFHDWDESLLRSIQAPTLFITADQDIMKPEHTAEMWRLVPGSRLLVLPATHGSYMMADDNGYVDHPLIVTTLQQIKKFLTITN